MNFGIMNFGRIAIAALFMSVLSANGVEAQTQITVTGPQSGFPIAIPVICDAGGAGNTVAEIPATIRKDLEMSGVFNVLEPSSFVESPGKCS